MRTYTVKRKKKKGEISDPYFISVGNFSQQFAADKMEWKDVPEIIAVTAVETGEFEIKLEKEF